MAHIHCNCEGVTRRDLLKLGGKGVVLGALGMTLADKLFLQEAMGVELTNPWYDCMLNVFFNGGPSQTDTWDPKPGSQNQNPAFTALNLGVNDAYGQPLIISSVFPQLANLVQNDPMVSMGVIRSMVHGSNDHGNGKLMMGSFWQGQLLNVYPSTAPVMAYYGSTFRRPGQLDIPSVVIQGNNADGANDARGANVPTALQVAVGNTQANNPVIQALSRPTGVDSDRYARRKSLLDKLNARFLGQTPDSMAKAYQQAVEDAYNVTARGEAARAFDLTGKTLLPARTNDHAMRFTLAQELLKAGVPYVTMGIGGNDSHDTNTATINGNWGQSFDQAIAGMINNLKATGKKALITAFGDFGRTPDGKGGGYQNGDGRDHWGDGFSAVVISVNQPKFKTSGIGQTGPDGMWTLRSTNRGAAAGRMIDPVTPAGLGYLLYSLMLGPELQLRRPDGLTDVPTAIGREAPPVDMTVVLDPTNPQGAKLFNAFFPA